MKHTSGTWRMEGRKIIAGKGFSGVVAEVHEYDTPEGEANGKLIAASPDLLSACQDMLAQAGGRPKSCGHEHWCPCPYEKARAAIAKTEGRQ